MSQCELKSKLDKAEKERRELLVKAQNEMLLTSILTSGDQVSSNPVNAEIIKAMLDTFDSAKEVIDNTGKKVKKSIYQLALAVNTAYLPNEKSKEENNNVRHNAVLALLNAINGNKDVSIRMKTLRASAPDTKYTQINLSMSADEIVKQLQSYIGTDSKIDNRIKRIYGEINNLVSEKNSGIKSKQRQEYVEDRLSKLAEQVEFNEDGTVKIVDGKPILTFNDIKDAINNAEKVLHDDINNFPPVYMIHEADSHYIEDSDQKKTMEYRNTIEKSLGYDFRNISNLENIDNDIIANSNNVLSSNKQIGDELSTIGILFGKSVTKDENGKSVVKHNMAHIPDFLKNSIKINAIERMADIYKVLGYEQGSEDFNKLWGISSGNLSYSDDIELISALPEGSIPASFIVQNLGKAIYKSLPIKFSHEISSDLEQKAITELGLYGLEFMHRSGLAKYHEIGNKEDGFSLQSVALNDGKKTQVILSVNISNNELYHDHKFIAPNKVNDLVLALQHMSLGKDATGVSDSPILEQSKTVRNSILEKPKSVRAKLENMMSKPLQFTSDMISIRKLYEKDKNLAYALAGILEPQGDNIGDKIKSLAKINYEKMMFDDMIAQYDEYGIGNNFYLKYDYTVSGRYMIDSILNPQTSKITRFLVTSGNMNEDRHGLQSNLRVENGLYNQDDLDNFKTAVAQAFDLDPDKKSDKDTYEQLDKIVQIKTNGTIEFKGSPESNVFLKAYNELKKLDGDLDFLNPKDSEIENAKSNRTAFINAMKDATDEGGFHTIQALMALKAFSEHDIKNGDHRSNITLESDAITSGMILTLIGIGTESAIEFAAKGGIYTDEVKILWKKSLDEFNKIARENEIEEFIGLKDANGEFKLTHGWLRSYVSYVKKAMEENSNVKESMVDGEYQTKFADFYETVAGDANEEMTEIQKELESKIPDVESQLILSMQEDATSSKTKYLQSALDKLKNISAMIDVVGSIKRSTAKPAVMVYIYGAMLSSIKKKLTGAIAVPKLYEILNKMKNADGGTVTFNTISNELLKIKSDYDLTEAAKKFSVTASELRIVKLALSNYILEPQVDNSVQQSNVYIDEFGNEIIVQNDEGLTSGSKKQKRPLFQHVVDGKLETIKDFNHDQQTLDKLVISPDIITSLQDAVNGSLGEAFEKGFQQFKFIDEYRDSVKTLEVVRFSIFKYKYRKAIDRMKRSLSKDKNGNYQIGNSDISNIIAELEKDGYGHSVDDINGGKQSLYKREALEKEVRMVLLTQDRTRSSAIEGKDYGPNTGAAGVITVHSVDGLVDSTSSAMFNLIRIYDGSVSGIDSLVSTLDSYNDTMFKAFDWNSYNTQANLLQKELNQLSVDGEIQNVFLDMSDIDKDALINTIEKLMGYGDIEAIDINHDIPLMQQKVDKRIAESIEFRKDGKREVDINHSYLTDKADPVRKPIGMLAKKNVINKDAIQAIYDFYKPLIQSLQARKRFNKFGEEGKQINQLATVEDSKKTITKDTMPAVYKYTMETNGKASIVVYPDNAAMNGSNGAGSIKYGKTTNIVGIPVYKNNLNSRGESQWQSHEVDDAIRQIGNAFDRIPRDRGIIFTYHKDSNGVVIYDLLHKVENPKIQEYIAKRINEFMFGTDGYKQVDEYVEPQKVDVIDQQEISDAIRKANTTTNANKYTEKEIVKSNIATQYIGFGSKGSSTYRYRQIYGKFANTGKYTASDIVWVSSNGKRNGRVNPVDDNGNLLGGYKLVDKAIAAGATIIMDTVAHLRKTKTYNLGEMQLGRYLATHGYTRVGETGEWKPKANESILEEANVNKSTDAAKDKSIISHEIIKKAFIDSMKGIIPSKDAAVIADEVIKDC